MDTKHLSNESNLDSLAVVRPRAAAVILNCSIATVWRLIERGKLESVKISDGITGVRVRSIRNRLNGEK